MNVWHILSIVGTLFVCLQGIIIWLLSDIKASIHSLWAAHDTDVKETAKEFKKFEGRVSTIEAIQKRACETSNPG